MKRFLIVLCALSGCVTDPQTGETMSVGQYRRLQERREEEAREKELLDQLTPEAKAQYLLAKQQIKMMERNQSGPGIEYFLEQIDRNNSRYTPGLQTNLKVCPVCFGHGSTSTSGMILQCYQCGGTGISKY